MKALYRTKDGRIQFEVQAENVKGVFKEIAAIQEIFDAEKECGYCKSNDIRLQHRNVDDNDFFELTCNGCGARFQFGQNKKGGGLFPKRRSENGPLPDGGWAKFKPSDKTRAA